MLWSWKVASMISASALAVILIDPFSFQYLSQSLGENLLLESPGRA